MDTDYGRVHLQRHHYTREVYLQLSCSVPWQSLDECLLMQCIFFAGFVQLCVYASRALVLLDVLALVFSKQRTHMSHLSFSRK